MAGNWRGLVCFFSFCFLFIDRFRTTRQKNRLAWRAKQQQQTRIDALCVTCEKIITAADGQTRPPSQSVAYRFHLVSFTHPPPPPPPPPPKGATPPFETT